MAGRSLKVSLQGIEQAKRALLRNSLNKKALALELGIARSTVHNFFSGKAVDRFNFEEICKILGLEWQEIVDMPPSKPETEEIQHTISKNPDFVGREDATADSTSEDDLNELVQRVRSRCYDKIQGQCGKMQLLNISQRVDLDDLYVDVNILKDIPSQRYQDVSQLAREFDPSANDFNRFYLGKVPGKLVSGLEVVKDLCKVMVLGKPGSGKTTFLHHVAIKCNQGRLQADRVPIFIQLFRYAEDARDEGSMSLWDYIDRKFHLNELTIRKHLKLC